MKTILYFKILIGLLFCSFSFAQTTYYLPGTGSAVKELNFESTSLLTEKFNYGNGWAGTGFGLTGTQRGAPEIVSVIANPQTVASSGNQALAFRSQTRDASWYTANPSAVGTTVYGGADTETQDDFFMTGTGWLAAETPSVMMHVFVPTYADNNSIVTSLRMPVKYNKAVGVSDNSWPGIWCYGSFFYLRGPGRSDIGEYTNAPNAGKNTWWTFGLSITPDGDIQYYATPTYVTELTKDHLIGSNSVISANARSQSTTPQNYEYFPVIQSNDAIIMSSNVNTTAENTLIDRLYYTKGTTTVLSVLENTIKSITIYPNPTSNHLFVSGVTNSTSFKIIDNLGRIMNTGIVTSESNKIEVNLLPKGVYHLVLKGYKTNTFIKE